VNSPKNQPTDTFSSEPISKRHSVSEINKLQYDKNPGKLGSYQPKEYLSTLKYKVKEIMQCFRNDKIDGKLIYKQADANNR